jgi:lysozyme
MTIPYLPQTMSDVVIDLSHWEAPVDFAQVKASGIVAVILKATQGTGFVDPTFASRAVAANAAGLLPGAYHFFDTSDPTAQAGYFLATIARTGVPMLMALDFEPSTASQITENNAAVFVSTVKMMTGNWPVLYTGRWDVAPAQPNFQQCALWLAEYGSSPICPAGWSEWKLWQHTDGQIGSGVAPVLGVGRCDRERFAGTISELAEWWSDPTP